MNLYSRNSRKWISRALFSLFVLVFVAGAISLGTKPVYADDGSSNPATALGEVATKILGGEKPTVGTANSPGDIFGGIGEALGVMDDKILKPMLKAGLMTVMVNFVQFIMDRLAYEAAMAIATGAEGQTPMIFQKEGTDLWKDIGMDIAGEAVGSLSEVTGGAFGFDLCAPPNPLVRMNLQLGIKQAYQPPEPKCDILEVGQNWQGFIQSAQQLADNPGDAIIEEFSKSLKPGKNELSASIEIMLDTQHRVDLAKRTGFMQALSGGGFKSASDFVTGQVKTPTAVIDKQFNEQLSTSQTSSFETSVDVLTNNSDILWMMLFQSLSVFTNTLLSQMMNKVYTGLFEPSPEIDPFDVEDIGSVLGGREQARQRFAEITTPTPQTIDNYNILAEFITCPTGGVAIPNINNCVMDQGFAAAVSRGKSDTPLTVQEAIDEGLLHGDWPLLPSVPEVVNQDPLCYTSAYCYGNLVKMRKARILPVGWEMAAERNQNRTTPATLQEIIDGFDDCSPDGSIDDRSYMWCHLIDPNWVLKYPETMCKAFVNGDQLVSTFGGGRAGVCVDAPSCVQENNDGTCTGEFGYCIREKNTWRFRGDECPSDFASCLSFENTDSGDNKSLLVNTIDASVCSTNNAGCLWYRTNKYLDDKDNTDPNDDTYEFLPGAGQPYSEVYTTNAWDQLSEWDGSTQTHDTYTHEDRIYFDRDVQECSVRGAGCTKLYPIEDGLVLNVIPNGDFETDEDGDGLPDFWSTSAQHLDTEEANSGDYYMQTSAETSVSGLNLAANAFYTFSAYAKASDAGDELLVGVELFDQASNPVSVAGLSYQGDCSPAGTFYEIYKDDLATDAYERVTCTFTTPADAAYARVYFNNDSGIYFDDVQLELGANASRHVNGYSSESVPTYLTLAPDYLSCQGQASDPNECNSYTQICSAQDVGCNLYTPTAGGPSVPAIISELDACPAECVGYAAFKQEATKYEQAFFPEYFIAETAAACTAEQVGCDSFTNLDSVEAGGEGVEHYTDLRACLKPADAGDNTGADRAANYFTWEGTDQAGYQLQSWWLLASDVAGGAPCVNWQMNGASSLICVDGGADPDDINPDDCDGYEDLVANPDCREFFDENGVAHYREYSQTVTISENCHPYRKTISVRDDCLESDGWYTNAGECRYFGLPEESGSCPVSAAGCRAYTGGGARNQSLVFEDNLEDGSVANYMKDSNGLDIQYSNESLAPDGHSLRVYNADSSEYVAVTGAYMASGCANPTGCMNANGAAVDECVIPGGENICGPLADSLVGGKVFNVEFLAKGNGSINVILMENGGAGDEHEFGEVELSGAWQVYTLGPLDTSGLVDALGQPLVDETAVLAFQTTGASEFFLDNIRLLQAEDNITLIKDSWVTPAACDQTPTGVNSPQYYLGCQAYTDRDSQTHSLYQFSRLCGEDKVGCEAYYHTYNSDSPYGRVENARCINGSAPNGSSVGSLTPCEYAGKTVCSIAPGTNFCLFDLEGPMARPLPANIVLGPEAKVVPGDKPLFLVDNGSTSCSAAEAGCMEVGRPVFNRDKSEVTGFESAYYINDPDQYETNLCPHEALFCAEWSSTKDGNFYFKDPLDQTCEYKTNITIQSREFRGWFRKGTSEPCIWRNEDGQPGYNPASDYALIINGNYFGVWRNGDADYDGWVAACGDDQDLCTEFIDRTDTALGTDQLGYSYYFKNNQALSEENLSSTQRCNNQVSRKLGCGLFQNTSVSAVNYAADPSYLASDRANDLYGDDQFALVDPISCNPPNQLDDPNANLQAATLCAQRCLYQVGANVSLSVRTVERQDCDGTSDGSATCSAPQYACQGECIDPSENRLYAAACLDDADCSSLNGSDGRDYPGTCVDVRDPFGDGSVDDSEALFRNDSNTVLKVIRDRECSEWLACDKEDIKFDERSQKWVSQCVNLQLCDEGSCNNVPLDPVILSDEYYAARDITWTGQEYSGYSIPDQLPVIEYSEINLNPEKWCLSTAGDVIVTEDSPYGIRCTTNADCPVPADHLCDDASELNVLVHDAGPCDDSRLPPFGTGVGRGGDCRVGYCLGASYVGCSSDNDCGAVGASQCVIGYCQDVNTAAGECYQDSDCPVSHPHCDKGACVDKLTSDPFAESCVDATECGGDNPRCANTDLTKVGSCFNNRCLTTIEGQKLVQNPGEELDGLPAMECRGYPEIDSPFPSTSEKVVLEWTPNTNINKPMMPVKTKLGFEQANICHPVWRPNEEGTGGRWEASDDCLCSYDKAVYGDETVTKYFKAQTGWSGAELIAGSGICVGGTDKGQRCGVDDQCKDGICAKLSRVETIYGWPGFCIEHDSSRQLYGSSKTEDRACLTWLPVDRLDSATDLYGKDISAGYVNEDTYYCTEVGYYVDLYTIGTKINPQGEVVNADDEIPIDYACAASPNTNFGYNCNYGQYGNDDGIGAPEGRCWDNAWCPKGWFAVLGFCDSNRSNNDDDNSGNLCKGNDDEDRKHATSGGDDATTKDGTDDCPYFCVPDDSVHMTSGSTTSGSWEAGDLCEPGFAGSSSHKTGIDDTKVYTKGNLHVGNEFEYYKDCVVRGVPMNTSQYDVNWYFGKQRSISNNEGYFVAYDPPPEGFGGLLYSPSAHAAYGVAHRVPGLPIYRCGGDSEHSLGKICDPSNNLSDGTNPECDPNLLEEAAEDALGGATAIGACIGVATLIFGPIGLIGGLIYCPLAGIGGVVSFVAEAIDDHDCKLVNESPDTGSMQTYLGCYEITQVAKAEQNLQGSNPDKEFNKAWTNRLWEARPSGQNQFRTSVVSQFGAGSGENYSYSPLDEPVKAGKVLLADYYSPVGDNWMMTHLGEDTDTFPVPLASCKDPDNDYLGTRNLYTVGDVEDCDVNEYPKEAQYGDLELVSDPWIAALPYEDIDKGDEFTALQSDWSEEEYSTNVGSSRDTDPPTPQKSVRYLLNQYFAKTYKVYRYDWRDTGTHEGAYELVRPTDGPDITNIAGNAEFVGSPGNDWDPFPIGTPDDIVPKVMALGLCYEGKCAEGPEDTFSINNNNGSGNVLGEGSLLTTINFFTYAHPNHMPIRNIIVDWGDNWNFDRLTGEPAWGKGRTNQVGSMADDNYYKNRRGTQGAGGDSLCDSSNWGATPEACDNSYLTYTNEYKCSLADLERLKSEDNPAASRECVYEDGNLIISPCYDGDKCVFQPRVYVKDNWGYCTGYCNANVGPQGTETGNLDQCYGIECNPQYCPNVNKAGTPIPGSECPDWVDPTKVIDPWVYYDGVVEITAQ